MSKPLSAHQQKRMDRLNKALRANLRLRKAAESEAEPELDKTGAPDDSLSHEEALLTSDQDANQVSAVIAVPKP